MKILGSIVAVSSLLLACGHPDGGGKPGGSGSDSACQMTLGGDVVATLPCQQSLSYLEIGDQSTLNPSPAPDEVPPALSIVSVSLGWLGAPAPGTPALSLASSALVTDATSCYIAAAGAVGSTMALDITDYLELNASGPMALGEISGTFDATLVHRESCTSDAVLPGTITMHIDLSDE